MYVYIYIYIPIPENLFKAVECDLSLSSSLSLPARKIARIYFSIYTFYGNLKTISSMNRNKLEFPWFRRLKVFQPAHQTQHNTTQQPYNFFVQNE